MGGSKAVNDIRRSTIPQKLFIKYNLIEPSDNYSMTSGSSSKCYRNQVNDVANETVINRRMNNNKIRTSRSFDHKATIMVRKPDNNNTLDTEVVVPLKYLRNFWRSLDLPLVNREIEIDLSWLKDFIITDKLHNSEAPVNPSANPPFGQLSEEFTTDATFKINSAKPYLQQLLCL